FIRGSWVGKHKGLVLSVLRGEWTLFVGPFSFVSFSFGRAKHNEKLTQSLKNRLKLLVLRLAHTY
ncbi:MAG: hypothetical protein ACFB2Y_23555, partial [Fulvivirga sp.]